MCVYIHKYMYFWWFSDLASSWGMGWPRKGGGDRNFPSLDRVGRRADRARMGAGTVSVAQIESQPPSQA